MKRYMVFTGELREPYDENPSGGPFVDVYKASDVADLQAKIDALMLEYCPGEMTQEQKDRWAAAQRAAHNTRE